MNPCDLVAYYYNSPNTTLLIPSFNCFTLKLIRYPNLHPESFMYLRICARCTSFKASTDFISTITFLPALRSILYPQSSLTSCKLPVMESELLYTSPFEYIHSLSMLHKCFQAIRDPIPCELEKPHQELMCQFDFHALFNLTQ